MMLSVTYHDEATLFKVDQALKELGIDDDNVVTAILSSDVFFREMVPKEEWDRYQARALKHAEKMAVELFPTPSSPDLGTLLLATTVRGAFVSGVAWLLDSMMGDL